eukprot:FR736926.1.p1 GENE.FR736926.1~~FR736926.1.p1  ORF type:complete len:243 (+),score=7.22 FR736926.1:111-731(+)
MRNIAPPFAACAEGAVLQPLRLALWKPSEILAFLSVIRRQRLSIIPNIGIALILEYFALPPSEWEMPDPMQTIPPVSGVKSLSPEGAQRNRWGWAIPGQPGLHEFTYMRTRGNVWTGEAQTNVFTVPCPPNGWSENSHYRVTLDISPTFRAQMNQFARQHPREAELGCRARYHFYTGYTHGCEGEIRDPDVEVSAPYFPVVGFCHD